MRGKDVDETILRLIAAAQDRQKAELVRAAAVRLMPAALEFFLQGTMMRTSPSACR